MRDDLALPRELVNGGRSDLAERELRAYLSQMPASGAAHALLAMALIQQHKRKEALASAREALRLEPLHPWSLQAMAVVQVRSGRRAPAERAAREALAHAPHEPALHALLCAALLNRAWGRPFGRRLREEALRAADAGLAVDPGDAECLRMRAQALMHLGRVDEAREAAQVVLRAAPGDVASHTVKGVVEIAAGDAARGRTHLRDALRLNPTDPFALQRLGVADENARMMIAIALLVERIPRPLLAVGVLAAVAAGVWGLVDGAAASAAAGLLAVAGGLMPSVWARRRRPDLLDDLRAPGALGRADLGYAWGWLVFFWGLGAANLVAGLMS